MKSAQKGIEMKLIQILALAIAMATMATAQNSSAKSTPTPSPTPTAAGKSGSTAQPGAKKTASTGTQSATKASSTAATTPAATKTGTPAKNGSASNKPQVATTTTTPAKGTQPVVPAKGGPAPVVAAKTTDTKAATAKTADTKKTEAKKADTKKADTKKTDAAKPPAVIAVKPVQPAKKGTTAAATKAPAKTPAPKVTQAASAEKPSDKPKPSAKSFGSHNRRDPFVSPIVAKEGVNAPRPNCTNGKRCLVIPELVLQGTLKDTSGKMMAVVANSTKRTYFLRENDQVFQGSVEKITSDSIIFREYIKDALGRETAREVVKKLVPAS
jgi:Tfp pilus assembly protein PilP